METCSAVIEDASGELHTNFSLNKGGDDLALIDPTGITVQSWDPFPAQQANISYGVGQNVEETKLVPAGAATFALNACTSKGSSASSSSSSPPSSVSTTTTTVLRAAGDRPDPTRPEGTDLLPQVEHIVVVMMENRSFDHFLGWVPSRIQLLLRGQVHQRLWSRGIACAIKPEGRRISPSPFSYPLPQIGCGQKKEAADFSAAPKVGHNQGVWRQSHSQRRSP